MKIDNKYKHKDEKYCGKFEIEDLKLELHSENEQVQKSPIKEED